MNLADDKMLAMTPERPAPPKRRLTASMLDSALSTLFLTGLTFVTGIIVARLLGVEGRGDFGEIQYWAGLVTALGTLSVFEAAVFHARDGGHDAARHLSALLLLGLVLAAAATLVFVVAHQSGLLRINHGATVHVTLFMLAFVGFSFVNQAFVATERARMNFGLLVLERLVTPIAYTALLIAVFALGIHDIDTILAALAASMLPLTLVRIWKFRAALRLPPDMAAAREVLKVGLRFHGATVLKTVSAQIDRAVIVTLWPSAMVGLYFVAYSAAGAGYAFVVQAASMILMPAFAGLTPEHRLARLSRTIRLTILLSAGIAVVMAAVSPWLIPLAFGRDFAEAGRYAQYLAVALSLLPLATVVDSANRSAGRGRPGLEMSAAYLAAFLAGYALTGYRAPEQLFLATFLCQALAVSVGIYHLVRGPVGLRLDRSLVPGPADIRDLASEGWRYVRPLLGRGRVR
jgi:O-antigen/teichoic acid export membrane protein